MKFFVLVAFPHFVVADANVCGSFMENATEPLGLQSLTKLRDEMMTAAKALIATKTHYTQDATKRWNGITKKVYPPKAPI